MEHVAEVLVGLAILLGLVGILVPVVPGLLLVWAAVLAWAVWAQSMAGWVLLGVSSAMVVLSQVVKYVVPGRRLGRAGVPTRTMVAGGAAGVVGFFVLPVLGLLAGFVCGVYVAERIRLGGHRPAWRSTGQALQAAGLAMLIELLTGLLIAAGWLGVVVYA